MNYNNWFQVGNMVYELKTKYDNLAVLSYDERINQWILECESIKLYTSLVHSDIDKLIERANNILNVACNSLLNTCELVKDTIKH